jgi:hypothetical protein
MESGLSFLGLGPPPPTPSWGRMVEQSGRFMAGLCRYSGPRQPSPQPSWHSTFSGWPARPAGSAPAG